MRTGRRVTHAASASSGCTDTSSLPPNPPPHAVGLMRTRDCATPSTRAVSSQVHVGRLRAGRDLDAVGPVADRHRVARLRLDVGMLDEARLERAFRGCRRARVPRLHVAALRGGHAPAHCPARPHGLPAMPREPASMPEAGVSGVHSIGSSASEMPSTAARVPTSASTASPRKRTWPGASTGWSFIFGKMPNAVLARHVLGGEDRPRGRACAP